MTCHVIDFGYEPRYGTSVDERPHSVALHRVPFKYYDADAPEATERGQVPITPPSSAMPPAKSPRSKTAAQGGAEVDALMATIDHPDKPGIQTIRSLVLALDPRIREEVKWNAPSFFIKDHFATFKLRPLSSIQLVLHTGAKVKADPKAFVVKDPLGLLKWAAKDRCLLTVGSGEEAIAKRAAIAAVLRSWIRQLESSDA